jgi:glycosyltransferase involved in cell wall biosynthesis
LLRDFHPGWPGHRVEQERNLTDLIYCDRDRRRDRLQPGPAPPMLGDHPPPRRIFSARHAMTSRPFRPGLLHRAWRLLPAQPRRRAISNLAALLAPRIDPGSPVAQGGIAVIGELSRPSGLGEGARLMLRALEALQVPSWAIDVGAYLPAGGNSIGALPGLPPPGVPLVIHVAAPLLPLVLLRLPRALLRGRRIVGYWAWELPDLPPEWRVGARFVHEVWVPSPFTAAACETLLPGRVRVVPHPLATAPPEPAARDRRSFGWPDGAVVVLVSANLASSFTRKNPLAAIAAFRAAFGQRLDRLLVLKLGNPAHFPADFARVTAAVGDAANIRIDTTDYPIADVHAMTAAADIVLSLHRSEGFGLVLAEAMLLGRPVIATGWSGNMAFMDADSAALVGYRLVPTEDARAVYHGSRWAEPDQGEAVSRLRQLADDATARAALGARGRQYARAALDATRLADAVRGLRIGVAECVR